MGNTHARADDSEYLASDESIARQIVEHADSCSRADVRDAEEILKRCEQVRLCRDRGDIDGAIVEAYNIRGALERICRRDDHRVARLELDNYMFDLNGRPFRVGAKERAFLQFFTRGRTEADLGEIVNAVYNESWGCADPEVRREHRNKLDKLISRLNNEKLYGRGITFTIQGDRVRRVSPPSASP